MGAQLALSLEVALKTNTTPEPIFRYTYIASLGIHSVVAP